VLARQAAAEKECLPVADLISRIPPAGFSQDPTTPPSGHHLPVAQRARAVGQVRRLVLSRELVSASLAVEAQECPVAAYQGTECQT
jgi:hypothetical protein